MLILTANILDDAQYVIAYYEGMIDGTLAYQVFDNQTNRQATRATYPTRRAAMRTVDRLDLAYGACRYSVRPVIVTKK